MSTPSPPDRAPDSQAGPGAPTDVPAVEASSATAGYGREPVLRALSLGVRSGEVFALLGRNGSGKTTLVASLMGFRPVRSGTIRILGRDPWKERASMMREIGYVPETPDAPPDVRVDRIARFCAALYPTWDQAGLDRRLERFAISARKRFGELSRGQRGLVSLALALAPSPRLLILDDPTLGFDAVAKGAFYEELIGELADRGVTVFLTTHDLAEVERIADRIAILHDGRIALEGSPDRLKQEHAAARNLAADATPTLEELLRDLTDTRAGAA